MTLRIAALRHLALIALLHPVLVVSVGGSPPETSVGVLGRIDSAQHMRDRRFSDATSRAEA
jgi:hypothetical protein